MFESLHFADTKDGPLTPADLPPRPTDEPKRQGGRHEYQRLRNHPQKLERHRNRNQVEPSGSVSSETADIQAAALLERAASVRSANLRMRTISCPDKTLISYEGASTVGTGGSYNNSIKYPSDNECLMFHPSGGGLSYTAVDEDALDKNFSTHPSFKNLYFVRNNSIAGSSSHSQDMIVPFVSDAVCQAINKKLFGKTSIPTTSAAETVGVYLFRGTFFPGGFINCPTNPVSGTDRCGGSEGCFKIGTLFDNTASPVSNVNVFYTTIMTNVP